MLLDVWLGKVGRWRAGDAQALVHQLVASVPRVRYIREKVRLDYGKAHGDEYSLELLEDQQ